MTLLDFSESGESNDPIYSFRGAIASEVWSVLCRLVILGDSLLGGTEVIHCWGQATIVLVACAGMVLIFIKFYCLKCVDPNPRTRTITTIITQTSSQRDR